MLFFSVSFAYDVRKDIGRGGKERKKERKQKMEGSVGAGFMAVFAVSGSVVFIAREVHKRLLSDFMKKIESELGGNIITDSLLLILMFLF